MLPYFASQAFVSQSRDFRTQYLIRLDRAFAELDFQIVCAQCLSVFIAILGQCDERQILS